MGWVIVFIVSWLLFLIMVDWRKLKFNIWSGLLAVVLQLAVDTNAGKHGFYEINNPVLTILRSSAFFPLGPVFTIGVLLAQFHPKKRWMVVIHVFVVAVLYSLQEVLVLMTGELVYTNWDFIDSVVVNISAITVFSWFTMIVLNRKGGKTA